MNSVNRSLRQALNHKKRQTSLRVLLQSALIVASLDREAGCCCFGMRKKRLTQPGDAEVRKGHVVGAACATILAVGCGEDDRSLINARAILHADESV